MVDATVLSVFQENNVVAGNTVVVFMLLMEVTVLQECVVCELSSQLDVTLWFCAGCNVQLEVVITGVVCRRELLFVVFGGMDMLSISVATGSST